MTDPCVLVTGFARQNLHLEVQRFVTEADKRAAVIERVAREEKPGLLYTATRKDADAYAEELKQLRFARRRVPRKEPVSSVREAVRDNSRPPTTGRHQGPRGRVSGPRVAAGVDPSTATASSGTKRRRPDVRPSGH